MLPNGRGGVLAEQCKQPPQQLLRLFGWRFGGRRWFPCNANADGPLVDIQSVDPTIMVDLRYAGRNNLLEHPLYPQGTRALARPEVASALTVAQAFLRRYQYGLKIWDAYRPVAVQTKLWEASHNSDYVANPEVGVGSLHSWGIAVDATTGRLMESPCTYAK